MEFVAGYDNSSRQYTSYNNTTLEYLKNKVGEDNKSLLGGDILHVQFIVYILNLIMTNDWKYVHELVVRVRSVMRFVRFSPVRLKKFNMFVCVADIQFL